MSLPLYDPNDEKDNAARIGIQTHRKAVALLDAKIASLLDVVETLQDLKRNHQDQLRRFESVLTLAGRLPADILGCIFEHCVQAFPSAPLVLSQVCVAWRMAARSTPRLWSRIFVNCSERRSAEKANHWLSMSEGRVPLHITLRLANNDTLRSVMHILLPSASRWSTLTVDAELPFLSNEVLLIIREHRCTFWNLETVDFIVHDDMEDVIDFRTTFDNSKCPQLRTIHFLNSSWHWANFPRQITILNLVIPATWISPQFLLQTMNLLRELPRLEQLSLSFSDGSLPRDDLTPIGDLTLVMPHLRTLILTGCHQIFEVLAHLILPSLRHLALRATGKDAPQTTSMGPSLLRMMELSSSHIKTLELYDIDASDGDFTRCFDNLPDLEGLFLHDSEISNAVFRRFCSPSSDESRDSWICPKLRRLDLRWCSQLSGKVLVELVKARSAVPETSRILEVVVVNCSFVREEDVLSLAALTVCRLANRPEDFCFQRGCCTNNRYRHRFILRHAVELRQRQNGQGRLEF